METIAFLGCSRGLGREVVLEVNDRSLTDFFLLSSRKLDKLNELADSLNSEFLVRACDYAKPESIDSLLTEIHEKKVSRVFYFAAGGPYGVFASKGWKDHQWALQVSFLTPAKLLHSLLKDKKFEHVNQVVFIGSQIADCKADPKASSYAASKHGLRGLIESVLAEGCDKDLRLFRPGYMDTEMLPVNAKPRQTTQQIMKANQAAKLFVDWVQNPEGPAIYSV